MSMSTIAGIIFDGVAYGSLLFLISLGLSVTMGLMNFVNLAHGAFAMMGGFACVTLMRRSGLPFLGTLPAVFLLTAGAGALLEVLFYRRLYRRSALDQVLFTIGLTLMSVAAATFLFGSGQQPVRLPPSLLGQTRILGVDVGVYRLFLIGIVLALASVLALLVTRTRFGAQVRAAVDDARTSAGLGIDVERVFSVTFVLGSGLAGLGGALGIDVLGLDPTFPLKYLVYFLLVVVVGGAGTIVGTLAAAMVLGVFDVIGKYYVPSAGAFVIYALMVVLLLLFPRGLLRRAR
jgi:branched-chain amino acid transport system permease protein